jgi:hypothetical protein
MIMIDMYATIYIQFKHDLLLVEIEFGQNKKEGKK